LGEKITEIIKFINTSEFGGIEPEAAVKVMPDWYKDAPIFTKNKVDLENNEINHYKGIITKNTNFTIKKCMPVFDTMSSGYILKIQEDIDIFQSKIEQSDEEYSTHFAWKALAPVSAHHIDQIEGYPISGVHKIGQPKFVNYWVVKTPPGYSCLFITPMHRGLPFNIMPGIVDTDTFDHPVSFPFSMNEKGFEGTLKAGTPMAQVIPFKRDEFSSEVYLSIQEYKEKYPDTTILSKLFPDSYKKTHWHKKFFK